MGDEELVRACEFETQRRRGPGGQHRNKTESGVRLVLRGEPPVTVTAAERRSQHQNRREALERMRIELALGRRAPPGAPASWRGPWDLSQRNPHYPLMLAAVFDALEAAGYQLSTAGAALGLSTGKLVRLLADEPHAWAKVVAERQRRGLPPLRA